MPYEQFPIGVKVAASLRYRADIDGLRAVAVTAVVACHAGAPGLAGGFAGVDVFFVISGFLITSLLMREEERTGKIDLGDFFARRIRRILPPLAIVVLASILLGFAVLLPTGEQQTLGQSALAATGFVSNLYFAQSNSGYFAAPAQFIVLLHTWSLAIEEQFYLFWPPMVIAACAVARRHAIAARTVLVPVVAAGCLLSFSACLLAIERAPTAAFYFTPFRAWELGLGALLALLAPRGATPKWGALLGGLGLAAIAGGMAAFTSAHTFPFAALIAAGGTAALIAAGDLAPSAPTTRMLASPPLVWLGRLSYAWYLWHWPLLAVGRIYDLGAPSLPRDAAMIAIALGLAVLTRVLIESPSRTRWKAAFSPPKRAFATGALLSLFCALAAGSVWVWGDLHRREDPVIAAVNDLQRHPIHFRKACDGLEDRQTQAMPPDCALGATEGESAVLIWGDSHARHLTPGLAGPAAMSGVRLIPQLKSGCRPGLTEGRYRGGPGSRVEERCRQFNQAVTDALTRMQEDGGVHGVIIASRWSRHDGWRQDLAALLHDLHSRGLRVLVVADPPFYPFDVPGCLVRRGEPWCSAAQGAMAREREADTLRLKAIASGIEGVRVWDPAEALCEDGGCKLTEAGRPLYSDWHHLSPAGSALVGAKMSAALEWLAGRDTPGSP